MLSVALNLLLVGAVVFFIVGPPLTLLHELGHALLLSLAGQPATIYLGRPDPRARPTFRLGKIEARIRRPLGFGGQTLYEEPESGFSPEGRLLIALGGPAASALAALAFGLAAYLSPDNPLSGLLGAISIGAFLQFFVSMIPVHYPRWLGAAGGRPSDGLRIMRAMGFGGQEEEY